MASVFGFTQSETKPVTLEMHPHKDIEWTPPAKLAGGLNEAPAAPNRTKSLKLKSRNHPSLSKHDGAPHATVATNLTAAVPCPTNSPACMDADKTQGRTQVLGNPKQGCLEPPSGAAAQVAAPLTPGGAEPGGKNQAAARMRGINSPPAQVLSLIHI